MSKFITVGPKEVNDSLPKLYDALKQLCCISKVIGVFPVVKSNKQPSSRDWVYLIAYIVLYTALLGSAMFNTSAKQYNNMISDLVLFLIVCMFVILSYLTIIFGFWSRRLVIHAIKCLSEIDNSFQSIGIRVNYVKIKNNIFKKLTFMFISVILRTSLLSISFSLDPPQIGGTLFVLVIKSLLKYQFIIFVLLTSNRFVNINRSIRSFYKKKNAVSTVEGETGNMIATLADNLYALCRLHYKLCNVTRILNKAYAFQLLVSLACSLANILFQSYFFYILIINDMIKNYLHISSTGIWLMDEIIEVYLLVYACATTCENAHETSVILHEVRNNIKNVNLESYIQTYSLQMLHQKIKFSALGFFVIDYTLLYAIIGAVTTYLVIFIQFEQSSNNSSNMHENTTINSLVVY